MRWGLESQQMWHQVCVFVLFVRACVRECVCVCACGMRVFVKMGAAVSSCRVCWMRWGLESQQVWLQVCVCVCVCVLFLACVCV